MTKIITKCIVCGKKLTKGQVKFCSRDCYYKWQKLYPNKGCFEKGSTEGFQKGHPFYKGGEKNWFEKGCQSWNKGRHIKINNALEKWRKNGGTTEGSHGKTNNALNEWREDGNAIRGENHWNWHGGTSKLRESIMALPEYKKWRIEVLIRDKYTCQDCKKKRKKLHVHHIKEFSKIIEEYNIKTSQDARNCKELWDIKNGKTVCIPCHKKYHKSLVNFLS